MLVLSSFDSAEAAPSPISISSDKYSEDILEGNSTIFTLTLDSVDLRYRNMDVYMVANWPSGIAWTSHFVDVNGDEFEENIVRMGKSSMATIHIHVFCDGPCSVGDTNELQIYGKTDPRFYTYDGNVTDTCGSSDCKNDTTPASGSANVTNIVSFTLTARTVYDSAIACDAASSSGDNVFTRGDTYLWGYTVTNTGLNNDTYQFGVTVTNNSGVWTEQWKVNPGLLNGFELNGHNYTSSTAKHEAEAVVSLTVPADASGVYKVNIIVTPTNGTADSGCTFDVSVPGSETEEETNGDPANETAEEETKEETEELPEEVSAISLIPVLVSIGLIAVSRRK